MRSTVRLGLAAVAVCAVAACDASIDVDAVSRSTPAVITQEDALRDLA